MLKFLSQTNSARHDEKVYQDLAPMIYRQRLVVEGYPRQAITASQISEYLAQLSTVLDMRLLGMPVTHQSPKFGWAGWVHWETSGAHFYAWDAPLLFFSVDIYTCKAFSPKSAVDFTAACFDTERITFKEF